MTLFLSGMTVVTCLSFPWFNHPVPYQQLIVAKSCQAQVNPRLVSAVIRTESNFNPRAIAYDPGGGPSLGLMQIKIATSRWLGMRGSYKKLFSPSINITYGVKYLALLLKKFHRGFNAVAAYNFGHPALIDKRTYCNQKYVDRVRSFYYAYSKE